MVGLQWRPTPTQTNHQNERKTFPPHFFRCVIFDGASGRYKHKHTYMKAHATGAECISPAQVKQCSPATFPFSLSEMSAYVLWGTILIVTNIHPKVWWLLLNRQFVSSFSFHSFFFSLGFI